METYHLTRAQDNATGEYLQVGYIKMQDAASRMTQFWLLASISCLAAIALYFLTWNFGKLPASFTIGLSEIPIGVIVPVVALISQVLMHLLVLRVYGARPELGVLRNGIAYISVHGFGLRRNSVILAALAPPVMLIGLFLMGIWVTEGTPWVALFGLIAVVNAAVSTSHLEVLATLLRYPSNASAVDDEDGMRILMRME